MTGQHETPGKAGLRATIERWLRSARDVVGVALYFAISEPWA
jgi:hypothetical protein